MPSYFPPKINTEYIFYIGLVSQADTKLLQVNPTIAAGDFKVSIDGAALANPATLPAVTPAGSRMVKVTLSAAEMNGDNITLIASDAAGGEWCDQLVSFQTTARQLDDLAFPTTSGRSIDVSTTGEVGLDFANIKAATAPTTLTNITVPAVTTVTTTTTATNLTNAPTAGDFTATMKTSLNSSTPAATLNASERNAVADALLLRDQTLVASPAVNARVPLNGIRLLNCKWEIVANTLQVYAEDDTTIAWSASETVTSAGSIVTGSDPA